MDQAQNLREMIKNSTRSEQSQPEKNMVKQNQIEENQIEENQLRPIDRSHNSKIITVTSGKGGVGKTSVSVNMAIQFRQQGKSVIIFDADFGLANIEVMFGAVPKYNLTDLVYRGKELKDIIMKGPMDIGFISGGSGVTGFDDLSKDQIVYLVHKLKELESIVDIIIIDTGAGISSAVMDFVVASDEVLLVTTPEPTSITDSYSLLKALNKNENFDRNNTRIRVITNRVSSQEEGTNLYNKLNVVVNKFLNINLGFLGAIEADVNMSKAIIQQKPVCMAYPNSKGAKAFTNLAKRILELPETEAEKPKGLSMFFMRKFKMSKGG